jgi:hypothetical protein
MIVAWEKGDQWRAGYKERGRRTLPLSFDEDVVSGLYFTR